MERRVMHILHLPPVRRMREQLEAVLQMFEPEPFFQREPVVA